MRNLISHNTLIGKGLALGKTRHHNTMLSITDKGRDLYKSKADNLTTLFTFPLEKSSKALSALLTNDNFNVLSENELYFTEGNITERTRKVRVRSAKLREVAIEHYSSDGVISSLACSFEFNKSYGSDIGKSYIEMHHIIPICDYKENTELDFDEAISNITPLCANCHRVVHINSPALPVAFVKNAVFHNLEKSSI